MTNSKVDLLCDYLKNNKFSFSAYVEDLDIKAVLTEPGEVWNLTINKCEIEDVRFSLVFFTSLNKILLVLKSTFVVLKTDKKDEDILLNLPSLQAEIDVDFKNYDINKINRYKTHINNTAKEIVGDFIKETFDKGEIIISADETLKFEDNQEIKYKITYNGEGY